ncbi:MAG: HlyD family efflux transporter periplasmic adaptor subunit [Planctomycetota bacterium]
MDDATATLMNEANARAWVDRLVRFDGPPDQFLRELLIVQCRFADVPAGAVLRLTQAPALVDGSESPEAPENSEPPATPEPTAVRVEVLAAQPAISPNDTPPLWLAHAVEALKQATREQPTLPASMIVPVPIAQPDGMYGQAAREHLILLPTAGLTSLDGVEAFVVPTGDPQQIQQARQRLELSLALLTLYEMRRTLNQRDADLEGLATATRALTAANHQSKFRAVSLAFCNEIASRFGAERVSVGILEGKYVKLRAMSQTEHVNRKMAVVQRLEAAMEECLDQDVEVYVPASSEAGFVNRAHDALAQDQRMKAVCSLPLRRDGEPVAVITVEKTEGQAVVPGEMDFLRMACDLAGPRLLERHERDRWFGARWAAGSRAALAAFVGPQHTWAKAAAVGLLVAAALLTFVKIPYRIDAPFAFEAVTQRAVPAPFDGFLAEALAEPGDEVAAQQALGALETDELRFELAERRADVATYRKQADLARREGNAVDVQIAQAQADEAQARIDLLEYRLEQATLRSPIAGRVVVGDLRQQVGAPVRRGDVLFEVAPLDQQRAEMLVADADITEVAEGMTGTLAAASEPGDPIGFTIETIHPIAEVIDGGNVFRLKLRLDASREWLRPGIEGVANIDVGQRAAGWVWTRDARNWLRLKLWW